MEANFIRRVRKSGSSNCINIPVEIVKLLNLEEGELVKVTIEKVRKEVNYDGGT
jgi:antitoxin component of MazEF toxin-antitoxin module